MRGPVTVAHARAVLAAWPGTDAAEVAPLGSGLINDTFAVHTTGGDAWVLQRVHPVFDPAIHDNIARVTERLAERGLTTPRLVPTTAGARYAMIDRAPWRVMTRVPGTTHDAVQSPAHARAAAALLGRFHAALHDLPPADFVGLRTGVHDTARHLATLRTAVQEHPEHRLHGQVAPLAEALLAAAERLPPLPDTPPRIVHGDPKINNVVFQGDRAVAWIDLDTVAPMPLAYELGDAWRSWCNPAGEDAPRSSFDLAVYSASLAGWAQTVLPRPSPEEREGLLSGVEWITLELSARFLADALNEQYFGWTAERYPARGEHNLVRARSQWSLHEAVADVRTDRARILDATLG